MQTWLRDRWEKNGPGLISRLTGGFNRFLWHPHPRSMEAEVPVFCYHRIDPTGFAADLAFLRRNGYTTITADTLLAHIRGEAVAPWNSVVLSIDDGAADLHEVAYPLLREHRQRAVAFVCPGLHRDAGHRHDGSTGEASGLCTWDQLSEMNASGLVDVQAHTYDHRDLARWPRPVPVTGADPGAIERLREQRPAFANRREDLAACRTILSERLGKDVRHLATPRHRGGRAVRAAAAAAGFEAVYGGFEPRSLVTAQGSDPMRVPRLLPHMLRRLPGVSRRPLLPVLEVPSPDAPGTVASAPCHAGSPPAVDVCVVHHRGGERLMHTLEALEHQTLTPAHVLLVDDASDDGTVEKVQQRFPSIETVVNDPPAGRPSVGRNLGLTRGEAPLVMLLDHDVTLHPEALRQMAAALAADPTVAAVGPRLTFDGEPERVYLDAGGLHLLGVSSCNRRGRPCPAPDDEDPTQPPRDALLGGNMMWRRSVIQQLGGFNEGYAFGWGEDGELTLRARLAGYRTCVVPTARGSHEYRPRGSTRGGAQVENRLRLLATYPRKRTLAALLPPWLMLEAALWLRPGPRVTAAAWRRVWHDRATLMTQRRRLQAMRRVGDAVLFDAAPLGKGGGRVARVAEVALRAWWIVTAPLAGEWRQTPGTITPRHHEQRAARHESRG